MSVGRKVLIPYLLPPPRPGLALYLFFGVDLIKYVKTARVMARAVDEKEAVEYRGKGTRPSPKHLPVALLYTQLASPTFERDVAR